MKQLQIKLVRSTIGGLPKQKQTVKALGLTKMHKTVIKTDSPTIRGMIKVISHLVDVEEK